MATSLDNPSSTSAANTGIETSFIPEEPRKPDSSSTDAETLLRALRNVIIPLIRPADGEYKCDVNQTTLGPDGKEFVIALEKFMMSFLRSQRGPVGGVEVELKEFQEAPDDNVSAEDLPDTASDTEPPVEGPTAEENTSIEDLSSILPFHNEESPDIFFRGSTSISRTVRFEQRMSEFMEKALNGLRKHVFNIMPIRLLCFKPDADASKLKITLIERGEIYAHIASNFVDSLNTLKVSRNIPNYAIDYGREEEEELIKKYCQYAILSHTWLRGEAREVTYSDWIRGEFDAQRPGYQKLVNFCRTAWIDHGVVFGWMDTICINKESSAELDESIRSMYKWYQGARTCITYLAETVNLSDVHKDSWFTRGWTLQELVAPSHMKFYNSHWKKLVEYGENDKENSVIQNQVKEATRITEKELQQHILSLPISRRLEMAANRQVTREEDNAYSLMGILEVSISTAYGEGGQRALSRLLLEVINSSSYGVVDIFNWARFNNSHISNLLPSSLQGYLGRSSGLDIWMKPVEPIMITHLGLRLTILLTPAILMANTTETQCDPYGNYHAITDISMNSPTLWGKLFSGSYSVLDARLSHCDGWNDDRTWFQMTLGVLNVGDGGDEDIRLPQSCLAVALQFSRGPPSTIPTEAPITFTLNKQRGSDEGIVGLHYIKRSELKTHGMKLQLNPS